MNRVPGPLRFMARTARRQVEQILVRRRYRLGPEPVAAPPGGPGPQAHHNAYAPSPWGLLNHILPVTDTAATDVFVDFGCGGGRVLLEAASRYRFARVLGLEADPRLAAAARRLLSDNEHLYPGRPWEVVTADVLRYPIPDEVTVAYFFDPFIGPVFDAVITALEASVDRCPRGVRIVYLVPREIARLERVIPVRRGSAGWLRTGGRYDYFVGDLRPA